MINETMARKLGAAGDRVVARVDSMAQVPELAPLTRARTPRDGKAAAYVCERFTCKAPITDPSALTRLLER